MMNHRVAKIEISGIRKFFNKVAQHPEAISLTLGQPDFAVPENIKKAMIKAIENNKTEYTENPGLYELRKEICSYLDLHQQINYSPEEICVTTGGSEGLFSTLMALVNNGDKILLPSIAYPAYESILKILGAEIIYYHLNEDFTINLESIKEEISVQNIKAIVISYPSNPTGAILTKEDREDLYELLKNKDLYIITDEIYSSLCFEDYYSLAQKLDLLDKIILVSGFSKMFSMTGLRVGYVCAKKEIIQEIIKVHMYNVSCATSVSQWGALEGLKTCNKDVEFMKSQFIHRRDYVSKRLKAMGMDLIVPKGAFYVFPSIKKFGLSSEEFCEKLLSEAGVACVPGNAFGGKGEGHIRISYSYSIDSLEEGLNRIEKFIKDLR